MIALADGLELSNTNGLWWLVAVIPAIALLVWLTAWRRRARRALADAGLLEQIAPRVLGARNGLRAGLLSVALGLLAVALLDPRAGGGTEKVEQSGIDVMVVIDVSRSMLAEDAQPDRLTHAKQFAADIVDALGSDRVGLVEFAGVPALRSPLTFNHRTFLSQLETLSPQATIRGGSMLGDAIRLAASSLTAADVGKVIVILTDGEDMASEPVEAAATVAKERNIRIITIGIGDKNEGARIPIDARDGKRYLMHEGQEVWTKMDPTLLKQIAQSGDGFFVDAGVGQADMAQVAALLRTGLATKAREKADVTTKDPQFQWLALLALAALLLECTLAPRNTSVSPSPRRENA